MSYEKQSPVVRLPGPAAQPSPAAADPRPLSRTPNSLFNELAKDKAITEYIKDTMADWGLSRQGRLLKAMFDKRLLSSAEFELVLEQNEQFLRRKSTDPAAMIVPISTDEKTDVAAPAEPVMQLPYNAPRGEWEFLGFDKANAWAPVRQEYSRPRADQLVEIEPPKPFTVDEIRQGWQRYDDASPEDRVALANEMSDAERQALIPFDNDDDGTANQEQLNVPVFRDVPEPDGKIPLRLPIAVLVEGLDNVLSLFPEEMRRAFAEEVKDHENRLTPARLGRIAATLKFDDLNRAALPRQLHRVARTTCDKRKTIKILAIRIGRVVTGLGWALADVLASDKSVLLIAPPCSGKTTLLRDVVRRLPDMGPSGKRVVLLDRSDEVGGASAIDHWSIPTNVGRARLDDLTPGEATAQAFRNLSPTTIVCDEIAQKAEAEAILEGRRAATRIIATSHGRLQDLVAKKEINAVLGNIKEATVSDETARTAPGGMSKSRLDRSEEPAFDVLIEVQSSTSWFIHHNFKHALDCFLRSTDLLFEHRKIDEDGILVSRQEQRVFLPGGAAYGEEARGAEEGEDDEASAE
ncbi:hypothetical protein BDZ88DRAFT_505622 [Geranomyces variabilis]|nr:hypothetical protein BDZ88DRAFT_505622 [Geranomyces variabilis]KAJ3134940.1 Uncharacterized protein HDU90_004265 [Geranomyces variabilis]